MVLLHSNVLYTHFTTGSIGAFDTVVVDSPTTSDMFVFVYTKTMDLGESHEGCMDVNQFLSVLGVLKECWNVQRVDNVSIVVLSIYIYSFDTNYIV